MDDFGVKVNGAFADKAARMVDRGDSIELVAPPPRYVSRGGQKLEGALDQFGYEPKGLRCLDAGASTGGFTDCLLQRGAAHVVAVDVGYGQMHERLVSHPQVTNLERTNIKDLTIEMVGGAVDLIVGDLSFISLARVLPALVGVASVGADLILFKPQFEAGRQEASRGRGVIKDPEVWHRVLVEVAAAAAGAGAPVQAGAVSPIKGAEGNVEFLYWMTVGAEPVALDLAELVSVASGADRA